MTLPTLTLGGPQQAGRLLRLRTALGPDVLVAETLDGTESVDGVGFRFELTALSVDAHLVLPALLGQPVLLGLASNPIPLACAPNWPKARNRSPCTSRRSASNRRPQPGWAAPPAAPCLLCRWSGFIRCITPSRRASPARAWLEASGSVNGQAARATALSVDGRLAVGSMLVQGLGVWNGLQAYAAANGNADKQTDAWLAMADGSVGALGGFAELASAGWQQRLLLTAGKSAVEASMALPFLRGAGNVLGVAGNVVNAWMSFRDAARLEKQGNTDLAWVMRTSGILFFAGGLPLLLVAADFFLQAAIRRGLIAAGNVAARQVAKIVAMRLGTAAIGLSFPGAGWVLTVVAVGETVYVVMNTPTPFQTWLKGCYFGKSDSKTHTRASWPQEEAALKAMQDEVTPQPKAAEPAGA